MRVTAGGFDSVLRQHLQGQLELAFLTLARTPQLGFGLRHSLQAGAELPLQLEDARIGVPQASRLAQRIAWLVVLAHGVQPRQTQFVALPTAQQARAAFQLREVDAVCVGDPMLTRLQRRGDIRVVTDTRHLSESLRLLGGPVLCPRLSASAAVVESHAAELQAVARAVQRALRWLQTAGPMDLAPHAGLAGFAGDPGAFLSVIMHTREAFAVDGAVDERAIHNVLRILRSLPQGHQYEGIEPVRLYTARLASAP
ncbi:ABC transporter substrate-binding protein [Tepidimonas sp.]|uniref:ABC transporter substrate-binding protein n=1 Tax=Tepidimonas sp. TaxID=2002775 RepID=UPI002FE13099